MELERFGRDGMGWDGKGKTTPLGWTYRKPHGGWDGCGTSDRSLGWVAFEPGTLLKTGLS